MRAWKWVSVFIGCCSQEFPFPLISFYRELAIRVYSAHSAKWISCLLPEVLHVERDLKYGSTSFDDWLYRWLHRLTHTHTRAYTRTYARTVTHRHTRTRSYGPTRKHIFAIMRRRTYTYTRTHIRARTNIYIYIYIYIIIYIYIRTHTTVIWTCLLQQVCGGLLAGLGFLMYIDRESLIYMEFLHHLPSSGPLVVLEKMPAVLIGVGSTIVVLSFLGCYGACADSVCFLCLVGVPLSVPWFRRVET